MQSNIKYANILMVALAIAYSIIGVINLFGFIDAKVILLCSIVSFAIAVVQILDTIISGLKVYEVNVLKVSIGLLKAWGIENEKEIPEKKALKINEFKKDQKEIYKKYESIINKMCRIANGFLMIALIIFIFGLSTDIIKGNSLVADTLSLFSFALIFLSLVIQSYLEKSINDIEIEIKNILYSDEEDS